MTTEQNVVELLRQAYWDEWESAMNYLASSVALEGVLGEEIAADLRADVQEEVGHAERIASRLEILDEVPGGSLDFSPTQTYMQPPEEPTIDALDIIDGVIEAEEGAIELYTELAEVAENEGDRVTMRMAEDFLADEEEHLDEFRSFRREYVERSDDN